MAELLLTIVTVTKNCVATIDRTLDSVQSVKTSSMEYVIVDGVSTDGTLEAIRARRNLVDRLVSEPDNGIYNAMNKAVALARGRYVLFINGDDELVAEGFADVIAVLTQGHEQIVCATTLVEDRRSPAETLVATPWRLPFFNSIPHPSAFVARALLLQAPFREDLRIVSDYDFFLRAYLAKQSFRILPTVTALHHRGGASGNVARSLAELEIVRHDCLGWRYPLFNWLLNLYQYSKQLWRGKRHG